MGKNVNYNNPKKKKKRNGCLSCFLTLFVVTLVFNLLILTAGGIAGHYFTSKYLSMSIFQVAGVGWDLLKHPSAKKIVTNGYSDKNKEEFNNELKRQLFLKESVDLDVGALLDEIMGKTATTDGERGLLEQSLWSYDKLLPAVNADGGASSSDPMSGLIAKIADLYTEENIDRERLKAFDEDNYEQYLFGLNDRQLAAVLGDIVSKTLGSFDFLAMDYIGINDPASVIKLEQIVFDRARHTLLSGEDAGTDADVTTMLATVSLKIEDITLACIRQIPSVNGFVDFLSHEGLSALTKLLLPEKVYVSALVGLDGDIGGRLTYNNMSDKDVATAFMLVNNSAKAAGADLDVQKLIDDAVSQTLAPIMAAANIYIDFSTQNAGTIKMDLFQTLVNAANLNSGTQPGQEITGKDVLNTLASIIGSDAESAVDSESTWQDQYFDKDGNIVYKPANFSELERVDFEQLFLKEVSSKYLIDLKGADGIEGTADDITFERLMTVFGIGEGESVDIMSLFDSARMAELAQSEPESIRVRIDDRMLGAIVNSQLKTMLGADSPLAAYEPSVKQVMITTSNVSGVEHSFMEIGISVATQAMFGQIEGVGGILSALVGDEIMVSLRVDITPASKLGGTQKQPSALKYNDLDEQQTKKILNTVGKFAAELSIDSLLAEIEGPVGELIDQMEGVMPGISFVQSAIKMPNVFETVTQLILKDESGRPIVTGAEFQAVIGALTEDASGIVTNPAKDDYSGFMADIADKYYISANISTFSDLFDQVANTGAFSIDKFRLYDAAGKKGLFNDDRLPDRLKPFLPDNEIAAIIKEMMGTSGDFGQLLDIREFTVGDTGNLKLIIAVDVSSLNLGDAAAMLPVSKLYLTALIDTSAVLTDAGSGKSYYKTEVSVNDMTKAEFATLEKIMTFFAGSGSGLDLSAQSVEIGKLVFEQFETISNSLGMDIVFEDGGIELISFYDFLASAMNVTQKPDYIARPEQYKADIQRALQGLIEGAGAGNYDPTAFITNAIGATSAPVLGLGQNVLTDRQLGAALKAALSSGGGSALSLEQVNIYAKNCDDDTAFIRSFDGNISADKDYVMLTFALTTSAGTGAGAMGGILPDKLYFTVVLEKEGAAFSILYTRVNALSGQAQSVLFDLIAIDQSEVDQAVGQCVSLLNTVYGAGVLSDVAGDAGGVCGQLTVTINLP